MDFETGVALPKHGNLISGMGSDFRDINNDGFPDIYLVALADETFPLYENNKKGAFGEITGKSGMTVLRHPMAGYSPNIADFDNDGWKGIFVSRGDVQSLAMAGRTIIDQRNTAYKERSGPPSPKQRDLRCSRRSDTAAPRSETSITTAN